MVILEEGSSKDRSHFRLILGTILMFKNSVEKLRKWESKGRPLVIKNH